MGTAHSRWLCERAPGRVWLIGFLLGLQMERRARLRKLLAEMDEDEKVDRLGDQHSPLCVSELLAPSLWSYKIVLTQCPVMEYHGCPACAASLYHMACVHTGEPEAEQYVEATVQKEKFYTEGAPALRAARLQARLGSRRSGAQEFQKCVLAVAVGCLCNHQ